MNKKDQYDCQQFCVLQFISMEKALDRPSY